MISVNSIVLPAKDQSSSKLEGEIIILNLKSGVYYSLKAVGSLIWNLIKQQRTVNQIRDAILVRYKVERKQCENDLLNLLQGLESEGLIEVKHETAA